MKIILVGPVYPYRGGIAHHTGLLAHALRENGHQVQVVSFSRQYPAWLYPGMTDKDPSETPLVTDALFILDPIVPWTWLRAAYYLIGIHPDVILIEWWSTFWAPAYTILSYLLKRKQQRLIFFIHNVLPHERHLFDRQLTWSVLHQGKAFIVGTQREKARLLSLLQHANVEVCPLAVFSIFPETQLSKEDAQKTLQLDPAIPVILFFGIVRPYKGLNKLLDALGILHKMNIPFQLVIAGEIWGETYSYQNQIRRLSLKDHVRIDNHYIPDEEVRNYFSAADVFVAPYNDGSQSNITKMAVTMGLPLVATQYAVGESIESDWTRGVFVLAEPDPQKLAEALITALKDFRRPANCQLKSTSATTAADWTRLVEAIERMSQ